MNGFSLLLRKFQHGGEILLDFLIYSIHYIKEANIQGGSRNLRIIQGQILSKNLYLPI